MPFSFRRSSRSDCSIGLQDKKVHLDSFSSDAAASVFDDNRGEVISLTFSPDGKLLAAGDVSDTWYLT